MRYIISIAVLLLGSSCLLNAQSSAHSDPRPTTVQGCLNGADGSFTLTSHSGTTYELVGDGSQLGTLSGTEVSITGREGSASDISNGEYGHTGLATSNPTAGTAPTIKVMRAKEVSKNCGK